MEDRNLPDKADELITDLVNKDPLVQAAISLVPYVGGAVSTFIPQSGNRLARGELRHFLESLARN